jgi:hypothetical protein
MNISGRVKNKDNNSQAPMLGNGKQRRGQRADERKRGGAKEEGRKDEDATENRDGEPASIKR